MKNLDDRLTGNHDQAERTEKNHLKTMYSMHKGKIWLGIIAALISAFAYAGYYPHRIEDSTVTATGTYHGNSHMPVSGACILIPFTQPKIYVNNHQRCLRAEFADELNVGDRLSEINYTGGAWEECDYLESYTRK